MKSITFVSVSVVVCALLGLPATAQAEPAGTGFSYQGHLTDGNVPVTDDVDFEFSLWDDPNSIDPNDQVGSTQTVTNKWVSDGFFTVKLNESGEFGSDVFTGAARRLEIAVRVPHDPNDVELFATLEPRVELAPVPYALALPGLWTQQEPNCPNVIGGLADNSVSAGVYGATIGGGGESATYHYPNTVTDHFGTVGGGKDNQAGDGAGTTDDASSATVGGGWGNSASAIYATVGGGRANTASGTRSTVGGGYQNQATARYATIAGGGLSVLGDPNTCNRVTDQYGTVGVGGNNQAGSDDGNEDTAKYAVVSGGEGNVAGASHATVGGYQNQAAASYATIAGGGLSVLGDPNTCNRVTDQYGTVGGGGNNQAGSDDGNESDATYAVVSGGEGNEANASHATIGGGYLNQATAQRATIGGGKSNEAGYRSTVAGGSSNVASGGGAAIGGGWGNLATGLNYPTVSGGLLNEATEQFASVGGGHGNVASGEYATAAGGAWNQATGYVATISGGNQNLAGGAEVNYPTVGGGRENQATGSYSTVVVGRGHEASGDYATVAGGSGNVVSGLGYGTVGGGSLNRATEFAATVAGGDDNAATGGYSTVGGGYSKEASTSAATVAGGQWNIASGVGAAIGGGASTRLGTAATPPYRAAGRMWPAVAMALRRDTKPRAIMTGHSCGPTRPALILPRQATTSSSYAPRGASPSIRTTRLASSWRFLDLRPSRAAATGRSTATPGSNRTLSRWEGLWRRCWRYTG